MKIVPSLTLRLLIFITLLHRVDAFSPDPVRMLTIEEAVATALNNSRDINFSGRKLSLSRKYLFSEYRKFLPEIKLSYTDNSSVTYYGPDSNMKKITLGFTQLVYDRGVLAGNIRLKKTDNDLKLLQLSADKNNLIYSVINIFSQIVAINEEINIFQEALSNTRKQLSQAEKELQFGEITEIEYMLIQLKVKEIEISIADLIHNKNKHLFLFSLILNYPAESTPLPDGKINSNFDSLLIKDDDYLSFLTSAERNNLEYMSKKAQNRQAVENYLLAKKSNIPDIKTGIDFSAGGESFPLSEAGFTIFINLEFNTPGIPSSFNINAGRETELKRTRNIHAQTNPFSSITDIYSVTAADIAVDISLWDVEKSGREIVNEIKSRLSEIKGLQNMLKLHRDKIDIENKKYKIEELRLILGEIKRSELVENQISLAEQKSRLIKIINAVFNAEIELIRFSGKDFNLWDIAEKYIISN